MPRAVQSNCRVSLALCSLAWQVHTHTHSLKFPKAERTWHGSPWSLAVATSQCWLQALIIHSSSSSSSSSLVPARPVRSNRAAVTSPRCPQGCQGDRGKVNGTQLNLPAVGWRNGERRHGDCDTRPLMPHTVALLMLLIIRTYTHANLQGYLFACLFLLFCPFIYFLPSPLQLFCVLSVVFLFCFELLVKGMDAFVRLCPSLKWNVLDYFKIRDWVHLFKLFALLYFVWICFTESSFLSLFSLHFMFPSIPRLSLVLFSHSYPKKENEVV